MTPSSDSASMQQSVVEALQRMYGGDQTRTFSKVDIVRQLQNILISPRAERLEQDRDTGRIEGALNAMPDQTYTEQQLMQQLGLSDNQAP